MFKKFEETQRLHVQFHSANREIKIIFDDLLRTQKHTRKSLRSFEFVVFPSFIAFPIGDNFPADDRRIGASFRGFCHDLDSRWVNGRDCVIEAI